MTSKQLPPRGGHPTGCGCCCGGSGGSGSMYGDADNLRNIAPRMMELSGQMKQIVKNLTDSIDNEGACWGSDGEGQEFAKKYVPGAENTLQRLDNFSGIFSGFHDGLMQTADNIEQADKGIASELLGQGKFE